MTNLYNTLVERLVAARGYLLALAVALLFGWILDLISLAGAGLIVAIFTVCVLAYGIDSQSTARISMPRRTVLRDPPVARVLESMVDPIVLAARDGKIQIFNRTARALFTGIEAGRHLSVRLRDPDFLQHFDDAVSSGRPVSVVFNERRPVSRRIRADIVPVFDQEARQFQDQVLIVFHDLTDQEALDQMRTDFIANASHELRTPLASVIGFIETLQDSAKNDPEAQSKFLSIMRNQAERMSRLIDDLMSLSRVEMNRHVFPSDKVDLAQLLREVTDSMEPLAEKRDVTLVLSGSERPALVFGDRDQLVQVFQNLIQNGIKYGKAAGTVRISLADSDNGLFTIRVKDDGAGIPPEHLPRLTERFYRVNAADSRERGGTGLGLAIVKHVVNRHRGELHIKSKLGKGAEFVILLNGVPQDLHESPEVNRAAAE